VFFDPPDVGATVTKDSPYAEVESVKAVSDVIAPLSGEIVEVNEALKDAPEQINEDSYGEGWLVKVKLSDPSELDSLMDADSYKNSLS
jgi:glycine cleavage system H protein